MSKGMRFTDEFKQDAVAQVVILSSRHRKLCQTMMVF